MGTTTEERGQIYGQHSRTVHDPRHFIDENVVEAPRVVLLEAVYHELHVVQVDVLHAGAGTVEDQRHLLVGLFPGGGNGERFLEANRAVQKCGQSQIGKNMVKFASKNRSNMVKLSLFLHIFWLHFFGLMAQPLFYIE